MKQDIESNALEETVFEGINSLGAGEILSKTP